MSYEDPVQRGDVLEASDQAGEDYFGKAVAVSSNGLVLAVGAPYWDGSITGEGGVYIYDWSGSDWVQRGSVLTQDIMSEYFGVSVALSSDGAVLIVGAYNWNDGVHPHLGAVYTFDWSGSAWVQRGSRLSPAVTDSYFGTSVALSNNGLVLSVGAPGYARALITNEGAVYTFDWSGSAWVQRGSVLTAADAGEEYNFGTSVALSADGAILAVGSPFWDGGDINAQGGAYIYDWSGSDWVQRGSVLTAEDAHISDYYGDCLALSDDGNVLVIGASRYTIDPLLNWQGGVYIYDWSGSDWVQRGSVLTEPGATEETYTIYFGGSAAITEDKNMLVVGATQFVGLPMTTTGGVFIFDIALAEEPPPEEPAGPLTLAETNKTSIAYIKEAVWGTTPTTPSLTKIRHTGGSLESSVTIVESNEISDQVTDLFLVGGGASGSLDFELSYGAFDDFLAAAHKQLAFTEVKISSLTLTLTASTHTVAGTGCSVGLKIGSIVRIKGLVTNTRTWYTVATIPSNDSFTVEETLSNEGPVSSCIVYSKYVRNGITLPSFTIERNFSDIGVCLLNTGLALSSLALDIPSKAIITGSMGFIGRAHSVFNDSVDADSIYTEAIANVQINATSNIGDVKECGLVVADLYIKNLKVNYDLGLRAKDAIGNFYPIGVGSGKYKVTGSLSAYFQDKTLYNKFKNNTETSIELDVTDVDGNTIHFRYPRVKYSKATIDASGNDSDAMQNLDFTALKDSTSVGNEYTSQITLLPKLAAIV